MARSHHSFGNTGADVGLEAGEQEAVAPFDAAQGMLRETQGERLSGAGLSRAFRHGRSAAGSAMGDSSITDWEKRRRVQVAISCKDVLCRVWGYGRSLRLQCMERHFTVTGFLVHEGRTMLRWHRKNRMWLPPGGHIDEGEEPEAAVLREVLEESGYRARIAGETEAATLTFSTPRRLARPEAILLEDIDEPGRPHQHIDLIYFCVAEPERLPAWEDGVERWFSAEELASLEPVEYEAGRSAAVPDDVRELGLAAIARARVEAMAC